MTSRTSSPPASPSLAPAQRRAITAWASAYGQPIPATGPSAASLRRAVGSTRAVVLIGAPESTANQRLLAAWLRAVCARGPTSVLVPLSASALIVDRALATEHWHNLLPRLPAHARVLGYGEDNNPSAALAALREPLASSSQPRVMNLHALLTAIDASDAANTREAIAWALDWSEVQFAPLVDALGAAEYSALRHALQRLSDSLELADQPPGATAGLRCDNLAFELERVPADHGIVVLGRPSDLARGSASGFGATLHDLLIDGGGLRVWCVATEAPRRRAASAPPSLAQVLPQSDGARLFDAAALAAAPAALHELPVRIDEVVVRLADEAAVLCVTNADALAPPPSKQSTAWAASSARPKRKPQSGAIASSGKRAVSRKPK